MSSHFIVLLGIINFLVPYFEVGFIVSAAGPTNFSSNLYQYFKDIFLSSRAIETEKKIV